MRCPTAEALIHATDSLPTNVFRAPIAHYSPHARRPRSRGRRFPALLPVDVAFRSPAPAKKRRRPRARPGCKRRGVHDGPTASRRVDANVGVRSLKLLTRVRVRIEPFTRAAVWSAYFYPAGRRRQPLSSRALIVMSRRTPMRIDFLLNGSSAAGSSSAPPAPPGGQRCGSCGQRFSDVAKLRAHQKRAHARERPYACHLCDATFSEKGNKNKHLRAVHEKVRDFECKKCGAKFSFQDGLARHVRMVHEAVRPFKCEVCSAAFKQSAHLQKHKKSVHEKIRPAVCHCGAAFRERYNLRLHQKAVHGKISGET